MYKNLLLILSLILWTTLSHAFELQVNTWTDFEGTLGKTNIELSLFRFENGQIKRNYCYRKYDKKIRLIISIRSLLPDLKKLSGFPVPATCFIIIRGPCLAMERSGSIISRAQPNESMDIQSSQLIISYLNK